MEKNDMPFPAKSEFWNDSYDFVRPNVSNSSFRKIVARLLNLKQSRKDRALINSLLGATAGSNATATMRRVAHDLTELGGVRTIETETLVNRNTAAADDTELTAALLTYSSRPSTYPVDRATLP